MSCSNAHCPFSYGEKEREACPLHHCPHRQKNGTPLTAEEKDIEKKSFWGRMFQFTPEQNAQLNRRADEVANGLACL